MRALVVFIFLIILIFGLTDNWEEDYGSFGGGGDVESDIGDLNDADLEFVADKKRKGPSDLEIVYRRLAILTRITSAISLQYAAIKKSMKVRDVITELLRAPSIDLDYLAGVDTNKMITVLEERARGTEEIRNNDEEMRRLEEKKPILELMSHGMKYVKGQNIDTVKIKSFYSRITSGKFATETRGCDKNILNLVIKMNKLLIESSDHSIDKTFQLISDIKSKQTDLDECFKSLENYENNTFVIKNEFQEFQKLGDSASGIDEFEAFKKEISNFTTTIDLVISAFQKTQNFLTSSDVGSKIGEILHYLDKIMNPKHQNLDLSFTLGFPDHGDMAKVAGDLKSEWFKKNVARGKSVNRLGRELKGFFRFGVLMKNLEHSWKNLRDKFQDYHPSVNKLGRSLKAMEQMKLGKETLEIAQSSKEAFKKAWTNQEVFNQTHFNKVVDDLKLVGSLIQGIEEIQIKATEIGKEIDRAAIQTFFVQLGQMKVEADDDAQNVKVIQQFTNLDALKLLADKFTLLQDIQQKLDENLQTVSRNITSVDQQDKLINRIRNSGLRKNLDNLKDQGEKFQPDVLIAMMEFSKTIYTISQDSKSWTTAKNFLSEFQNIKRDLMEVERYVKEIGPKYRQSHVTNDDSNPILKMDNSQEMALSLSRGMYVLRDMVIALNQKKRFTRVLNYSEDVHLKIIKYNEDPNVKDFWNKTRKSSLETLIKELESLNQYAENITDSGPLTMRKILDEATKIQGIPEIFKPLYAQFSKDSRYIIPRNNFQVLSKLDLNFASHKGYLHAASMSFDELKTYFDIVFGFDHSHHEIEHNYLAAVLICTAIFLLIILGALIAYGFTKNGRRKYKNLYLFYFGKSEQFEKRWRYSLFMDRQDGKNALLDAAREINPTNVLKALKKGAYINVYNKYGNTALHVATKRGHPEIVEILIRNGADRSLLNAQNRIPEQMIPENYRKNVPDKVERFKRVEKIYNKYRKRTFRQRVPNEFPVTSYHIFIDNLTDDAITDKFTEKFQSITTDEASPTTTHFVVRTDKDGILETDSLDLLVWVLSGVIVVRDQWMVECLKDQKQISKEWNYLVKKIRYRGTVYDTVGQWREAMAKSTMPYLHGIYVAVVITDYQNLVALAAIVATHGGVICERFPEKHNFNKGFRPYLHVNMGPFIVIHDGKINLDVYKNDSDKMYTLMTESEFVHFLLKRKMKPNKSPHPIPALNDLED